jgi:hypothetical protein
VEVFREVRRGATCEYVVVPPPGTYEGRISPISSSLTGRPKAHRALLGRLVDLLPLSYSVVCDNLR